MLALEAEIAVLEDRLLAVECNLLHTQHHDATRPHLLANRQEYEARLGELRAERNGKGVRDGDGD